MNSTIVKTIALLSIVAFLAACGPKSPDEYVPLEKALEQEKSNINAHKWYPNEDRASDVAAATEARNLYKDYQFDKIIINANSLQKALSQLGDLGIWFPDGSQGGSYIILNMNPINKKFEIDTSNVNLLWVINEICSIAECRFTLEGNGLFFHSGKHAMTQEELESDPIEEEEDAWEEKQKKMDNQ